ALTRDSVYLRVFPASACTVYAAVPSLCLGAGRCAPYLSRSQEDRLDDLCRTPGGFLLRLRLRRQPDRPCQLRLHSTQATQTRRTRRVGTHSPGLGDRPSAPVLATGRAQAVHLEGPRLQQG